MQGPIVRPYRAVQERCEAQKLTALQLPPKWDIVSAQNSAFSWTSRMVIFTTTLQDLSAHIEPFLLTLNPPSSPLRAGTNPRTLTEVIDTSPSA